MDEALTNNGGQRPEQQPAAPARKRAKWPLLVIVLLLLIFAAPYAWRYAVEFFSVETTDNATLQGDVIAISSKVPGTVASIDFADNERVKPGQVLIKLDPEDYQIALLQAQAALELAKRQSGTAQANVGYSAAQSGAALTQAQGGLSFADINISVAQAGVETARSGLESSQAKLKQAQAQADLAGRELERARALTEAGVSPKRNLDQAETANKVAQAAVQSAQQDVASQKAKLAQAELGVTSARAMQTQSQGTALGAKATKQQIAVQSKQYETALAQVGVAEAAVKAAQQQLSYTTIVAPAAGRMGKRTVELGQRVTPGQPLVALVQDGLWVVANFKETQIGRIRPGQPVDITVDTYRGKVLHGTVDSMSPASGAMFALLPPENASGNFTKVVQRIPVKIVFPPGALAGFEDLLVPGMSVIVKVKVR